jgi:signal transduction histidine kinase/ActR/RegA family two-component response regulator
MAKKRTAARKGSIRHRRVRSAFKKLRQSLVLLEDKIRECEKQLNDEREARKAASAGNLAKDQFIATLSHELRTPLSSIIVWAELLQSGKLDAQTSARALKSIERNSKTQAKLVEDLLDVSRIDHHKLKLNLEDASLPQVLEAALDAVRATADEKGVDIQMTVPPAGCWVHGDPVRLRQVIWNLLSNSIKFTPAGGRVSVLLEQSEKKARITVSDTGKGISEKLLPHVFEPFKQSDDAGNDPHPGLGLGLAIVHHVVEMHQGCVSASSDGENHGSRFTVTLPLLSVNPEVMAQQNIEDENLISPLREKRILIVDDEADECAWLTAVLTEAGAEVVAVNGVDGAIKSMSSCLPDLVITDIGMPGKDGFHLLSEIRRQDDEKDCHMPVVALTAYAREQDRRRVMAAGFDSYITKPVEAAVLVRLLSTFIHSQQALKFANS